MSLDATRARKTSFKASLQLAWPRTLEWRRRLRRRHPRALAHLTAWPGRRV